MVLLFFLSFLLIAFSLSKSNSPAKDGILLTAFFLCLLSYNWVSAVYLLSIATVVYFGLARKHRIPPFFQRHILTFLNIFILATLFGLKYVVDKMGLLNTLNNVLSTLGFTYLALRLLQYANGCFHQRFQPHTYFQFLLFVFFLPIFLAGPIQPFDSFYSKRNVTVSNRDQLASWLRVVTGLIKVFAIPTLLSFMMGGYTPASIAHIFDYELGLLTMTKVWGALFFCTIYFYLNFSGYCDIAIGASKLLGFTIVENFDSPLLSTNLLVFWQRWHISLGVWCREFVFYPLSRLVKSATLGALLTFLLIGLWHGFNLHWLLFGLWHGVGVVSVVIFQKQRFKFAINLKIADFIGWILTMLYVSAGTLFSIMADYGDLRQTLKILGTALGIV
ncbi:MAG TPA: MBOAT family O-acyltransferase [Burkholderiaceae bacterium]|nr:MBOAT family O-acyltransferase [Burkholderiaceae bacterium]